MTRLLCNGEALDLYEGTGLQFKDSNPLFAFDKLTCERTTQFKLPATPHNNNIFACAHIPAYAGTGMRRKFAAQLQAGVVIRDGYLYLSEYDGKDYTAIFVTGEFIGLQTIKDLGKIVDIMQFTETATLGGTPSSPSSAAGSLYANVDYKHDTDIPLVPSIELSTLFYRICSQYNITAPVSLPTGANGVWIVPSRLKGVEELSTFGVRVIPGTNQPDATQPTDPFNMLTFDSTLFEYADASYGVAIIKTGNISPNQYFLIRQFKAKTNLKLTMPDNWPANLYLYDFSEDHYDTQTSNSFYGGRYFTKNVNQTGVTTHGEELAGRDVEILAGECFSIVDSDYFVYTRQQILGSWVYDYGWISEPVRTASYNIKVKTDPQAGDLVRLQDNLPDITFTDLLKTIAAMSGTLLNYTAENGIVFEDLASWGAAQDVSDLIERGEVKRTFADYAQNNIVRFDDENAERIEVDYTIDNNNLESKKDLQVVPFSEGKSSDGFLYVEGEDVDYIGIDGGRMYLSRVALGKNTGLQSLCTASTQFKIKARMSLFEYMQIDPKTIVQVDGTQYVWTERSWQSDTAKFTLAKIA